MGDLLTDLLHDRLAPMPESGVVNGMLEYKEPLEDDYSDSELESDTEQLEYVENELKSYHHEQHDMGGGLSDIDDGHEESILGSEFIALVDVPRVFDMYKFDTYCKKDLPIDTFRNKILDMINTNSVVVIHGPTGCGKTTQVPQYILDQCKAKKSPCNIVVTQPRRIAAINISQRVCEERGWAIGTVCGYQVGLDKNVGEDVVLTYMTTEVLLQKLITQQNLNKYTHILIDEVHERSRTLDFLLLIVRKYLFTNSGGVKIIMMSATMEAEDFAYYFRTISRNDPQQHLPAPIMHVNKKSEFTTSIYYIEQIANRKVCTFAIDEPFIKPEIYTECWKLISLFDSLDGKDQSIGSVLVFLPGYHEIEEMNKILLEKKLSKWEWEIIPLHSSFTSEHMVKVFQKPKPGVRKIILSTNIAESSVTVPDVTYVIDFCLTKVMVMNETTKFSCLTMQWASHNNCIQRAGRVGRVANGRVYRLVPVDFYNNEMLPNTIPELQRAPLENVILYTKLLNLNDTPKNVLSLALSPPNLKDVETCIWNLKEAGALLQTCRGIRSVADGDLTFVGRIMGSLPIDIRMAKLIILGHMFSCLDETIIMAAGCMTRNLFVNNFHDRIGCYRKKLLWADGSSSDLIILLNLYNVWLGNKRQNAFRTINEEYAWCKTNFVNLKGLREWEILIREITMRLKRHGIERAMGVARVQLSPAEKPMVLKIIICGAFYPNYFIRSPDFGQVDSKQALKVLNGRDPSNTVYFTNMKLSHPGHIYVRQIKKLMHAEDNPKIQIGFDGQSSKVFVEYKNSKQPEQVTIDGRQYVTTLPGNIALDVYEAVRMRQLQMRFKLNILPDHKAWEFANLTEEKRRSSAKKEVNCFTDISYTPLPTLDIEYITVTVTNIIDAGHFYCHNWSEETRQLLQKIFVALNGQGVCLEPTEDKKIQINGKIYAAIYKADSKFYRCKVLSIEAGRPPHAQVQFIDYGNVERVPINRLHEIPAESAECKADGIAMCCVLSEVQPHLALNPRALWSERVNTIFKRRTENVLLNAKVYSVVDDVVHLELFPQKPGRNSVSFNAWLINEGLGQKCEESRRSKMDHETRRKVLSSENPNSLSALYSSSHTADRSYNDFESPEFSEATESVDLKGPFSPLEMKVCGLVQASVGSTVRVDRDSVNAVLLDDNPEDDYARLFVAGQVAQSATAKVVNMSQATIMPAIPGLPMLMTLLFCPQMEPKLTNDGRRVASILCGLGCKPSNDKPNFPMHDISLVLDTELTPEIIVKINTLRYMMNRAVKTMKNIYEDLAFSDEMFASQKCLKEELFGLIHIKQKGVNRVNVQYADTWKKRVYGDVEIIRIDVEDQEDDIWPLHWFVKLVDDRVAQPSIEKNLEELASIAKRLEPAREIVCELCKSIPMRTSMDVTLHLFKGEHCKNLEKYKITKY